MTMAHAIVALAVALGAWGFFWMMVRTHEIDNRRPRP